jgi:S1-C subfamily serine protease
MSKMRRPVMRRVLLFLAVAPLCFTQEIPKEVSPFVRLGHRVRVSVYHNPVYNNESQRIEKLGDLVSEQIVDMPVGSGTIISAEGLVLTNFHVYNLQDAVEYHPDQQRVFVRKRVSKEMLVYRLKDNDPLQEPELQYTAAPVSLDEFHDTALLKIVSDSRGQKVSPEDLPFCSFSNPYGMRLNQSLTILGYPAKGGDTITITEGKFLGYYRNRKFIGLDGFIKTDAAMSPGNSGGAAINKTGIIGVPTAVTPPDLAGSDLGYIHPVTWAARTLTVARDKYGYTVQDIPVEWVRARYNTDETREAVYVTGLIRSADSLRPLEAEVVASRPDRSLEEIQKLHHELIGIVRIYGIQRLHAQGMSVDEISRQLQTSREEVEKGLKIELKNMRISNDAFRYTQGEFFYKLAATDQDGFFIMGIPRNIEVKIHAYHREYRMMVIKLKTTNGVSQHLGKINLFAY